MAFSLKAPYYNHNITISDFEKLADTLAGSNSHFVLSINDHPEMRKVFSVFRIRLVIYPAVLRRRIVFKLRSF